MEMPNSAVEEARNEIVFALKKQQATAPAQKVAPEHKEEARFPIRVENRDLEAAIDDMVERFPSTLEYLAK
ncbi:MAG: hypothetical protein K8F62_11865 [Pseudorhodoplanes sp.]|nr:hypothetical protein [Pseudorhodoplanes sp.]